MSISVVALLVAVFLAGGVLGAMAVGMRSGSRILELDNEVQELRRRLTSGADKGANHDR